MGTENQQIARILRLKNVINILGVSRSTVYNWLNRKSKHHRPDFPRPLKIGRVAIGWLDADIQKFLTKLERS